MKPDLAVLYEHPKWFEPLFAALTRRGIAFEAIRLSDHSFDPASADVPAPVVLSRVAMSSFLRESDHGIFYAEALLAHWAANGAHVLNGADVIALDSSKARQLSLLSSLGLATPRTRVVHRPADLIAAAAGFAYPLLVKANIGGSGAGIVRYSSEEELTLSIADRAIPESVGQGAVGPGLCAGARRLDYPDGNARRPFPLRIRGGKRGDSFDLCPADACVAQPGRAAIRMAAVTPPPPLVEAAERIARAARLDVGGVEAMIDERDGRAALLRHQRAFEFRRRSADVLGWGSARTGSSTISRRQ
jgi:hypothetical protein